MTEAEILIVSSDAERVRRVRELLQGFGYSMAHVGSGGEGTERLREGGIGAVLVDAELPDGQGTEFVSAWSVDAELEAVQAVLVVEGDAGEEGLRGALSAGAVDYLVEPVGAVELFARVGVALRIHRLIKRLRELSNRDGLTGLYDRRWAEGRMAVELERCARYRRSMSVAFVDLDGFAGICEEHGGHVGDLVLRQFADLARAQLRNPDVCARWGGGAGGGGEERFVVVFPETGALESSEALERMKRAAERLAWGVDGELQVTFSAGVAAPASRASGVTELLGEAERALHAARAAGKGRIFRAGEIPAPRLELITS